jgi:LPS sulfotransferase NodH
LCEALRNTELVGSPDEYFLCGEKDHWKKEYLCSVFHQGSTSNGVFGATIMWNYFPYVLRNLRELLGYKGLAASELMRAVFDNPKYIWLVRRNKVRQAVSWAKAAQTDVWYIRQGETPAQKQEPRFDFTLVDNLHRLILEGESGWQGFLEESGVQPFKVVYEELVEAYEATVPRILKYLGMPYLEDLAFGKRELQQQADAVNEAWVQQYLEIKQQMDRRG